MKRRAFLKSLGFVASAPALIGTGCASTKQFAKSQSASLRVLSCNVRVDVPADSATGDGWTHRRDFCAEVIADRKADLIGFQEMQVAHYDFLRSRMPEFVSYACYNPGNPPQPSNAIFYAANRFDFISGSGFWLSENPHVAGSRSWDSARSRFVVSVDLKDRRTGKNLRFWNTHLDHIGHQARENGAKMIVQAGAPLPETLPQIITGDFNAGSTHPAIKAILEGGWKDTYSTVHGPEDPGFTAHAFKGTAATPLRPDGTKKEKIDWIFCRGPLTPVTAEIIRDSRNGHYPSDHFFVSADISL